MEALTSPDPRTLPEKSDSVQSPLPPKRNGWIDYARGIAIIMVVVGHISGGFRKLDHNGSPLEVNYILDNFFSLFYAARMPLFFVISGLFIQNSFEKRKLAGFISYKWGTLLYPFLIWATIQLSFQLVGSKFGASSTERGAGDFLYLLYLPHKLDQFWFLYVLFEVAAIYALLRHFLKINRLAFLLIGLCTYFIYYQLPDTLYIFGIKYVCKFIFYLSLGNFLAPYVFSKADRPLPESLRNAVLLAAVFFSLRYFMEYRGFTEREMDMEFFSAENLLFLSVIMTGLALILKVSFLLAKIRWFTWLQTAGRYSLNIYCLHILIAGIARYGILRVTSYQYPSISYYLLCAVSVVLPILLVRLLNRFGLDMLFTYKPRQNK